MAKPTAVAQWHTASGACNGYPLSPKLAIWSLDRAFCSFACWRADFTPDQYSFGVKIIIGMCSLTITEESNAKLRLVPGPYGNEPVAQPVTAESSSTGTRHSDLV